MYLSDVDIRSRLNEFDICCDDPRFPFDPDDQVQPSSVDVRLSNVFWEPIRGKAIDLRRSGLLELSPRRYWKKRVLRQNECITLKPGSLLLGRVYERLTIPTNCAAKLEGRSSFARLGLSIHCTGDYVNPGYRGHMPLEFTNFGPNAIKLFPFIPIAQFMFIPLSSPSSKTYGAPGLNSKYIDDDGGPSYWWRDKRIRSLQAAFAEADIAATVQQQLLDKIGVQEPEIIEAFESFMQRAPADSLDNAEALLESFGASEDRVARREKVVRGIGLFLLPCIAARAFAIARDPSYAIFHYVVFVSLILSLVAAWRLWVSTPRQYLGKDELEASRQKKLKP